MQGKRRYSFSMLEALFHARNSFSMLAWKEVLHIQDSRDARELSQRTWGDLPPRCRFTTNGHATSTRRGAGAAPEGGRGVSGEVPNRPTQPI